MSNRRIVFNNNMCDGSTHCWFLRAGNCRGKVFQYKRNADITNRLIANVEACIGCEHCDGHCPAARLAVDEERDICMAALKDLEANIGVRGSDGLFAEPIINPGLNIYMKDNDVKVGVEKTLKQLNNYENRVQVIEFFNDPLCAPAVAPYQVFYEIMKKILSNEFDYCGYDRRVIYTDDLLAAKEFIKAFGIDENLIASMPLLLVYLNGKCLATWGHGEINKDNLYRFKDSMIEEITKQLRKNVL